MRTTTSAAPSGNRKFVAPLVFPSAARDGRCAARLWFQGDSDLPAATFRNQHFALHCQGRSDTSLEREVRRETFNLAFAEAVGQIVVEEGRFYAAAA